MSDSDYFVHESACVDAPCEIGNGTRIWHFSHVMSGVRIGHDCNLGQNVYIDADVQIGNRCKIQNNVSVYKGVVLEDGVFCGPSAVFTNVINPRGFIERKDEFKPTRVGRGATLGANCTVLCGTTIGAFAMIGAGAVITHDVADFALVYGVPARQRGWICACGVGLPEAVSEALQCTACQREYHLDGDQLQALAEIEI